MTATTKTTAVKSNCCGMNRTGVAYGPTANGNGCLVVMECFLHDLLYQQVEQDG